MTITSIGKSAGDSKANVWRFIKSLESLAGFKYGKESEDPNDLKPDRAALAHLRRTLGKHPNQAFEAFPYVEHWTGELRGDEWAERCYYLVGSLYALYQQGQPRRSWHHEQETSWYERDFGASFRQLEQAMQTRGDAVPNLERSKSLEKRFTALLSSRREDLPDRLRHAVSLLRSYEVKIDWVQLLEDLLRWKEGERTLRLHSPNTSTSTQRKWAQSFWRLRANTETEDNFDN